MTVPLAEAAQGMVLALEGSGRIASCALRQPDGTITELFTEPGVRHVEGLPQLVGEAADRAGVALSDLDLVLVGSGPGSYMGIRATVAVANALSYVAKCPVAELSTLDSLGLEVATAAEDAVVALEAGRGRYFVARYREVAGHVERTREPELLEGEDIPALAGTIYGLDGQRLPRARGHLAALDRKPVWIDVRDVAGAQPRYGPSDREA